MKLTRTQEQRARCALALAVLLCFRPAIAPAAVNLTEGSLGLQVAIGATNHLWANAPGSNSAFDRWIGDVGLLGNPYAWHTTLVTPPNAVSLSATRRE